MLTLTAVRRATAAAQAILQETSQGLVVDGKPGSFTKKVFEEASPAVQDAANRVAIALGVPGGMPQLFNEYQLAKSAPPAAGMTDSQKVFNLQVVPAVVRAARAIGANPVAMVAQLALESNWGKSTPRGDDGLPSFNYAGIKWNTVKTARKATATTSESVNGKMVRINDAFAAFDSPADFANAYISVLQRGRYKAALSQSTVEGYFTELKKGGYATDPNYVKIGVQVAQRVANNYALA